MVPPCTPLGLLLLASESPGRAGSDLESSTVLVCFGIPKYRESSVLHQ